MQHLPGKKALVTGAGRGIGKTIVARLRAEGALVAATDLAGAEIEADLIVHGDLLDGPFVESLPEKAAADLGGLDILVNNAALLEEGTVDEISTDSWQRTLAVNLTAPFLLIRGALPYLKKSKGAIVNIGSVEGLSANPSHPAYIASKGGLHALTRAVALDHGQEGVRCNAIAPGWVETEMSLAHARVLSDDPDFRERLKRLHPVGRTGKPEDVAALVVWLASDEAGYITGQVWPADGGRRSRLPLP